MPPKLTKAEREQLRREEADRKAREEEERRLREEEEEREREERERIEREEAARRQELQDARIAEETAKLVALEKEWNQHLETWKNEQAKKKEWNHYLSCSQLPVVTDQKALNSWISRYEDKPVTGIDSTLEDIKNCLLLCGEVECLTAGDGLPMPTDDKLDYYQQTIHTMRCLVLKKLHLLTKSCSLQADSHLHPDTCNLTLEIALPGQLLLCLWGNVSKNPRLKNFIFEERSFSLELPKPLILADIVISVLYPPFDTLTPLARSYAYHGEASKDLDPENEATGKANKEGEGREGGGERREGDLPCESAEGGSCESAEGGSDEKELEGNSVTEVTEDHEAEQREGEGEGEGGGEGEGEGSVTLMEDEIDLRHYRPAGGPVIVTILELPAPPKTIGQWTIRKVVPEDPQPFIYPQELSRASQKTNQSEADTEGGGETTPPAIVPGSTQWSPIEVTMSLPTSFFFSEEPQMAQWDKELNIWRTNGVKDVVFDMENNSVNFQTYHLSPLAIMVDQYTNMPYQSWEVVPKGLNHTLLTLTGSRIEVTIEIKDGECTLVETCEEPSLNHLTGQSMTARKLLTALRNSGVNLAPEPDGHKYCSIPKKDSETEAAIYRHIAMAVASFQFRWSRWNRESGRSHYVLQSAEVKAEDEACYSVYVCGSQTWRLRVSEDSEQFSMEMAGGSEVHSDLYSTLLAEPSPPARENVHTSSPSHTDTVYYWLSQCRLLTYSI